ncbi:DUF4328 domain-containing protein [Bernardetia sp. ABR2-2B]|uniref:DUF4328 domain-containing protein n=1 Tax=Bernardetia sp. ABR2-2B TaxID=3127472 RepID=UPI0030D0E05B
MESQILDDNSLGETKEELMRNNINRANYAIYAYSFILFLSLIVLLANVYIISNPSTESFLISIKKFILGINLLVFIVAFIFFLMWFRRAYKNIQLIGYETQHKDGWAVGGFFVPVISLYYPYNIITEIWQKMKLTAEGNGIRHYLKGGIHGWWWFFWLVSFIGYYFSFKTEMRGEVETLQTIIPTFGDIILSVIDVLDALFTVLVIKSIRDTEKELREHGGF